MFVTTIDQLRTFADRDFAGFFKIVSRAFPEERFELLNGSSVRVTRKDADQEMVETSEEFITHSLHGLSRRIGLLPSEPINLN